MRLQNFVQFRIFFFNFNRNCPFSYVFPILLSSFSHSLCRVCVFCPLDWRPLGGRQYFSLTLVFNLFLAVLGLHCCVGFSLVVVNGLILFIMLYGLLTATASLLEQRMCCLGSCGSWALEHRLKGCGPWA